MPVDVIKTPDDDPKKKENQEVLEGFHSEMLPMHETLQVKQIVESIRIFSPELTLLNSNFSQNREKKDPEKQVDDFVNYIVQGKLGSGENSDMEEFYNKLAYFGSNPNYVPQFINQQSTNDFISNNFAQQSKNNSLTPNPVARKLIYIMDNKGKNLSTILQEIEEIQKEKVKKSGNLEPLNKSESASIPQNLLQKGVAFFKRGVEIIAENISGSYESVGQFVDGIFRNFISFFSVKSSPQEKSKNGVTLCSKTAQINAKKFGIQLPSGNAKEGVHAPIQDKTHFVDTIAKTGNTYIEIDKCAPDSANFADVSIESDTTNGKRYGHRAVAFKANNGERYILDPYYRSYSKGNTREPMLLNDYSKHGRVEQVNFYNAPVQTKIE